MEPAPGNLFTDPAQGRLEIYAMGCRNPFRIHADPLTKAIVWGDVGGRVYATALLAWTLETPTREPAPRSSRDR